MIDALLAGIPASELAAEYGTPLVVYDLDEIDLAIDTLTRAFIARGITVAYAAKAFLCVALVEALAATPLWLDVCSLGELRTAESGGFPAGRIYFHGCGKTDEELRAIAAGRVAFGVVDNIEEIERLAAFAPGDARCEVVLRINTGIEAHTHEYIRTAGGNTKFGISLADVPAVLARIAAHPALHLIGLHAHVGSQIAETAPYVDNLALLIEQANQARAAGHPIELLIAGGGMGVEETPGESAPLDLETLAGQLAATGAGTPYRLAIEPGRAIVARAGTSLYRVMAIKSQAGRRFAIVDGGMADNPRPAIYGASHEFEVLTSAASGAPVEAVLCGRSCENDVLGTVRVPSDLRAGDLVALRTTGAYTYSMASNYNRFSRPAVVFARDGSHRLAVRRESADDTLRNDIR
ncbi:MAG: diaminopimelate decarboxylase [Candidatus Velthaea sp.]|jgi:diaminopimelate decarboxylase